MADKVVMATEHSSAVQNRSREKDFNSKNKNKRAFKDIRKPDKQANFVEEVKRAFMYGDVGHGIIVDKKV